MYRLKLASLNTIKHNIIASLSAISIASVLNIANATTEMHFGIASFYHDSLEGNRTACGQIFSQSKLTAAHKSLPCGTVVRVTRVNNGSEVDVVINDRGPFVKGRIIDLSRAAARELSMQNSGVAKVSMEILEMGHGEYRRE